MIYGDSWYLKVHGDANMHEFGEKATLKGDQLVAFTCM